MALTRSIEDALQSISRSKASGVLKLGDRVEAVFIRGALSHIEEAELEEVDGICGLLQDAGCLAESVVELVQQANMAVGQLGSLLVSKEYLSDEEFKRARHVFQKNKFLSAIENKDVQTEFLLDRSRRSNDDSLNILAGELLLDIMGMRLAQRELYGIADTDNLVFRLALNYELKGLTLEELIIVKLLQSSDSGISLEEIERRSLMSRSELFITLRILHQKGVANLGETEVIQAELDEEEEEEILSDLFDDALEAVTSDTNSSDSGSGEYFAADGYWDEDEESNVDFSFGALSEKEEEMSLPAELEPESNRWADNEADGSGERGAFGIGMRLRMINYRLTETTAVMHVVLVVTILYLVFLAWLMPNLLRDWFEALSSFTSFSDINNLK